MTNVVLFSLGESKSIADSHRYFTIYHPHEFKLSQLSLSRHPSHAVHDGKNNDDETHNLDMPKDHLEQKRRYDWYLSCTSVLFKKEDHGETYLRLCKWHLMDLVKTRHC